MHTRTHIYHHRFVSDWGHQNHFLIYRYHKRWLICTKKHFHHLEIVNYLSVIWGEDKWHIGLNLIVNWDGAMSLNGTCVLLHIASCNTPIPVMAIITAWFEQCCIALWYSSYLPILHRVTAPAVNQSCYWSSAHMVSIVYISLERCALNVWITDAIFLLETSNIKLKIVMDINHRNGRNHLTCSAVQHCSL